mmetsp:Transcript_14917/g.22439  ORF Transcript_14917/g.22439 Transcript_14917/m.22439 type:complete len:225 (-) Transcript_14917:176-850(-)
MSALHKLTYWGIPGRGEQCRLALHCAGLNWENNIVQGPSYTEMKKDLISTAPLMNLPLLEVDGKYFSESKAILRYAGRMGGMIPSDPILELKMNECIDWTDCIFACFQFTFGIQELEAKIAARQALCATDGVLHVLLSKIETYISQFEDDFVCGKELTVGDIALFVNIAVPFSGFLDGFPPAKEYLEQFPAITNYRKKVGTHPKVASRYEPYTEGPLFTTYKYE